VLHVFSRAGDWLLNGASVGMVGAEMLDFLPDPSRSCQGNMAFNQRYGPGTSTHTMRRALTALPLLLLACIVRNIFSKILSHPALRSQLNQCLRSGQIEFDSRIWSLPSQLGPFNVLVTVFSPSVLGIDFLQRLQAISFLIDLAPCG